MNLIVIASKQSHIFIIHYSHIYVLYILLFIFVVVIFFVHHSETVCSIVCDECMFSFKWKLNRIILNEKNFPPNFLCKLGALENYSYNCGNIFFSELAVFSSQLYSF